MPSTRAPESETKSSSGYPRKTECSAGSSRRSNTDASAASNFFVAREEARCVSIASSKPARSTATPSSPAISSITSSGMPYVS